MKFCPECGVKLNDLSRCLKCNLSIGDIIKKVGPVEDAGRTEKYLGDKVRKERGRPLDSPETDKIYKELKNKNSLYRKVWLILVGLFIALIFVYPGYLFVFAAGGILCLKLFSRSSYLKSSEYYQIPGSRTKNGDHICIFCGGRGIYRHTIYRTYDTLSDCSKCKNNLWLD